MCKKAPNKSRLLIEGLEARQGYAHKVLFTFSVIAEEKEVAGVRVVGKLVAMCNKRY